MSTNSSKSQCWSIFEQKNQKSCPNLKNAIRLNSSFRLSPSVHELVLVKYYQKGCFPLILWSSDDFYHHESDNLCANSANSAIRGKWICDRQKTKIEKYCSGISLRNKGVLSSCGHEFSGESVENWKTSSIHKTCDDRTGIRLEIVKFRPANWSMRKILQFLQYKNRVVTGAYDSTMLSSLWVS